MNIKLSQDTINYLEDIKVTIKITNKLNKAQEILFNKLAPSQIGPWGTSIIIQNANGEINKPNSPNFYVSTLIFADEKYSTHLSPNGTVSQIFLMKDIAVPKLLSDGHYKIQISYYGILSNKVKLVLKR